MAKSSKRPQLSSDAAAPQSSPTARAARFQGNMEIVITAVAMVAIFLMVNYLGNKYYYRRDFSPSQYFEISDKTRNVLEKLPATVTVISCMVDPELRLQVQAVLKEFKNIAGDKLTFEEIDPVNDDRVKVENLAKTYNFTGSDNVVVFQMRSRSKVVYEGDMVTYSPPMQQPRTVVEFRAEQQFTGAIQSLMEERPAKIYFLVGHDERSLSDLGGLGSVGDVEARLARENITAAPLSLLTNPQVPADADAVVIAGPKVRLQTDEAMAIGAYLERKGKVLLLQDPFVTSGMENLLQRFNIAIDNNIIKSPVGSSVPSRATIDHYADHPISRAFKGQYMTIPGARSLRILEGADGQTSSKITSLMETQSTNYGEVNFAQNPSRFDEDVDKKGPLVVAAAYAEGDIPGETQTGTRLIVVGSSTFTSNTATSGGIGMDFFINCLNWMLHREYANGITAKKPLEYPMGVSPLQQRTINWLALLIVPGITMFMGLFVWYTRRR
ncbi:MAG: GldG family protein [Candidatus Methylacidiphilales bacterium]|nr:GldG family protein [Candidatus Methylacidiphilales bacterium]